MTHRPEGANPWHYPYGWCFSWDEWNRYRRRWDGCPWCPGKQETVMALVPWRRGGSLDIGNAIPSCKACRREKGNRVVVVWLKARRVYQDAQNLAPAAFATRYGLESTRDAYLAQRRLRRAAKLAQLRDPQLLPPVPVPRAPSDAMLKVQMLMLQKRGSTSASEMRRRNGL